MPDLYIVAGCNGAGKTTGSFTILPEILSCKEFINADIIAHGLSPLNQESVAFEAGRIMLNRMEILLNEKEDFAFETTLSTKSFVPFIKRAKELGYKITLLFFWLESPQMARDRVEAIYNESEDWVARIMGGLQKAYSKLVVESAARNESLVVKIDGEVKLVPARDLMHTIVPQ